MTEADFRALCLAFPETVEGFNMGSTFFKANGKDLARLLGGGRAMLTGVPIEEVELRVEAEPAVFWADNHYKQARCLVAALEPLDAEVARGLLERRFREVAKKTVLKAWAAQRALG
jgi:hypothetical protein